MHIEREQHRSPSPGLTPLIDVVFILLVFFMLATRFGEWQDLPIQVSEARDIDAGERTVHRILVRADHRVEFDGETIPAEELPRKLRDAGKRDAQVQIRGDDDASLQQVLAVTDRVRAAGIVDAQLELLP